VGGAVGSLAGLRQAATALGAPVPVKTQVAEGFKGFLSGATAGALAGAYGMARGGGSPAGIVRAGVRIAEASRAAALGAKTSVFEKLMEDRGGTVFGNLAYWATGAPVPGENPAVGDQLMGQIKAMSNEDLGRFIAEKAGMGRWAENPETARKLGEINRGILERAYANEGGAAVHRYLTNLESFGAMSEPAKYSFITRLAEAKDMHKEMSKKVLGGEFPTEEFTRLDRAPENFRGALPALKAAGGAKTLASLGVLMDEGLTGLTKGLRKGKIPLKEGKDFADEIVHGKETAASLAHKLSGIEIPTKSGAEALNKVFREAIVQPALNGDVKAQAFLANLHQKYKAREEANQLYQLHKPLEYYRNSVEKRISQYEHLNQGHIKHLLDKASKSAEEAKAVEKSEEEKVLEAMRKASRDLKDLEELEKE